MDEGTAGDTPGTGGLVDENPVGEYRVTGHEGPWDVEGKAEANGAVKGAGNPGEGTVRIGKH